MELNGEPAIPWWEDPDFDWTSGNPGVFLTLLVASHPDWPAIEAVTSGAGCGFEPEPGASVPADKLWKQALRHAALRRRLPALMQTILANQATSERYPLLAILWYNLLSSPRNPPEGPIDGLQAITSARAGMFADAIASSQATQNLVSRTAVIRVKRSAKGTGFLVGDNLLLTAAHVVEAAKLAPNRARAITAVFDFNSRSANSYSETGIAIHVEGVIYDSPPTPGELGAIVGQDWEASPSNLDFALLQLAEPAPQVRAEDGTLISRGHYVLDPDSYDFQANSLFTIAQYPLGEFLKFSWITRPPTLNNQGTRIRYLGNTANGSSGGPVVDSSGNLVALHHYSTGKINQGVPASAIAQHLENTRYAGLFETAGSAGAVHFGVYSDEAKEKVCQGIANDTGAVARTLGVSARIDDAYALWDWLASHRTLYKLRRALVSLGHENLAHVLDYDLTKVDQPTVDHISDQANRLVSSILPASHARTPTDLLASTAVARHLTRMLRGQLSSLPVLRKHPLLALQWRMNWSQEFTSAETALGNLARLLPADQSEARRVLKSTGSMIRYAQETETAAAALKELARSPVLAF